MIKFDKIFYSFIAVFIVLYFAIIWNGNQERLMTAKELQDIANNAWTIDAQYDRIMEEALVSAKKGHFSLLLNDYPHQAVVDRLLDEGFRVYKNSQYEVSWD
jgi:hypothetical protein